ncbi:NAD(FAD)-dependent dehydrogenase [Synergistales bacterium]|nr:NAD(FAD)-dependent dehydrogenase [Synergistales bacterium]
MTIKGEFVCVMCPNGCQIDAEYEKETSKLIAFSGNTCPKGADWIKQEIESPMRTIATSVLVASGDFTSASVRTTRPIPRDKIFKVMDEIRALGTLPAPLSIGQALLRNPAGTDTDVVVTRGVGAA